MSNYAQKLQWHHVYGTGLKQRVPKVGPGFRLTIPGGGGSINYVWTESAVNLYPPGKRKPTHAIQVTAAITMSAGAVVVDEQTDDPGSMPPTMRVMLCRNMYGANNRWFGEQGIEIVAGSHTLTIPLEPSQWRQVYGEYGTASNAHRKAFDDVCESSIRLCLTFGAGNDYGHGVRMASGTCQVQVTSFRHVR